MKPLKIKVNKQILKNLKPCGSSWRNYLTHYPDFEGDLIDLLNLEHITSKDKIWVSVRLLPRQLVEVFAIDCAVSASSYAADAYVADAADAAASYAADAYVADAAAAAAAYAAAYAAAASYAADAYVADAADAAYAVNAAAYAADAYAADAAYAVNARKKERSNQIEAIKYLILIGEES